MEKRKGFFDHVAPIDRECFPPRIEVRGDRIVVHYTDKPVMIVGLGPNRFTKALNK